MNIITIDCGASYLKGALFRNEKIIKSLRKNAPVVNSQDLLKPVQICNLCKMVKEMIQELSDGLHEVTLAISNEMHGFLLTNEKGELVTDYISWQRELGSIKVNGISSKESICENCAADDIVRTGMPIRGGLPSSNLKYFMESSLLDKYNKRLFFFTLGDYLIFYLSNKMPICHITNAAATGLFDLESGEWNQGIIDFIGAKEIVFPNIGDATIEFQMNGVRIIALPAIGDQQAALLGGGVWDDTDLSFNLGTGGQVSRVNNSLTFDSRYQTRPYFAGKYINVIPHLPCGRALNVYIRFIQSVLNVYCVNLTEEQIWDGILSKLNFMSETALQVDLSFFENPVSSRVTGSISNIGEHEFTIDSLMAQVFTQMADNFLYAADMLQNGELIKRVIMTGGVAKRIDYFKTRITEYYAKDICVIVSENETMLGLCRYVQLFQK